MKAVLLPSEYIGVEQGWTEDRSMMGRRGLDFDRMVVELIVIAGARSLRLGGRGSMV